MTNVKPEKVQRMKMFYLIQTEFFKAVVSEQQCPGCSKISVQRCADMGKRLTLCV